MGGGHFQNVGSNLIHNNTFSVLQPINKTTIDFFNYKCNYKFMLMTA